MLLNLLGGIFGRNDAKNTEKRAIAAHQASEAENRRATAERNLASRDQGFRVLQDPVLMSKMVSDSEASGFNPLTVLRAGGLSAYGNANLGAADMYIPDVYIGSPQPVHHVPSLGSVVVKAAQDTANQIGSALSGGAGSLFSGGGAPSSSYGARVSSVGAGGPSLVGTAMVGGLSRTGLFGVPGEFQGAPSPVMQAEIEAASPHGPGSSVKMDPFNRPSDIWEQWYGELGQWYGGAINAKNNALYTVTGRHTGDRNYSAAQNQATWESFWRGLGSSLTKTTSGGASTGATSVYGW